MVEIIFCCPKCGGYRWHHHAEAKEWCCDECGTVCTREEMTIENMEKSYIDRILKLYEEVKADTSIPEDDRTEIEETLASLRDLLLDYSA